MEAPPEWRGTTVQVCGLFPWVVGGLSPTVGVPLGRNLITGGTVCCDPISWFEAARLILNPSGFYLGLPALGKSTLVRRQVIGLAGAGVVPLVLGDLKPDYVDTVRALGGQVVRLGRGLGSLNVLDVGALDAAAARLPAAEAARLREEAHGRRVNMVGALVELGRGARMSDTERTVLSAALRLLAAKHRRRKNPPLLGDLVAVLEDGPGPVRVPTLDRGDDARYRAVVDPLQRSLLSLLDGPLGSVFARPTTERISLDATAVCVDVSGISANDTALQAAVLLACWSEGFGAVEAANALADTGTGAQRRFFIVLDELWRVLRSGEGMVDKVDQLTRLNRNQGVGQVMISHSLADLRALRNAGGPGQGQGFRGTRRAGGRRWPAGAGDRRTVGDRGVLPGGTGAGHFLVDPARVGRRSRPARAGEVPAQMRAAARHPRARGPDPGRAGRAGAQHEQTLGRWALMPRAVSAGGGAGGGGGAGAGAAWVVPAVGAGLLVADAAVWLAGGLASVLAGAGWRSAPFSWFLTVQAAPAAARPGCGRGRRCGWCGR